MFSKKTIFAVIALLSAVAISEMGMHLIDALVRGTFVWQREEFPIDEYAQLVSDERYVTGKPNYRNTNYQDGTAPWDLEIDSAGFRVGLNRGSKGGRNIVFIGDSVPFGYRVGSKDTVPSILQDLLKQHSDSRGVINAAFPSYSLDQAVHRYHYELVGRYDIDSVVLQVYEPAAQFAMLGRDWDVTKNWASYSQKRNTFPFLRYSSLWHVFWYLHDALFFKSAQRPLDIDDRPAIGKYVASINASLDLLRHDTEGRVKRVLILPATPPPQTWTKVSGPHKTALTLLNQTLEDYAQDHMQMQFIDTNELFSSDKDGLSFIDECCHLSHDGAVRVANLIAAHL